MSVGAARRPSAAARAIERCLVIVNARAGTVRRRPELARAIAKSLGNRGEIVTTMKLDEVADAVRRARATGVDTIGICGGDGTNLHTLTAMARVYEGAEWPRIALLPGGTLNTGASNLGSRGPAPVLLGRMLAEKEVRVRSLPLLRVNGRVGLIFGSHMVARILDEYYGGRTGPLGATALAARIVASAAVRGPLAQRIDASEDVELEIDGKPFGIRPFRVIAAGVVPSVAVGMRLLSRAGEGGGFQLVATTHRASEFARDAARVWTGLTLPQLEVDEVAHRAVLRRPEGLRYTIDGDMFVDAEITLEALPQVDFVLP